MEPPPSVAVLKCLLQRDGVDARSLAEIKRRRIGYTLSIYFGVATTQIPRIFAKKPEFYVFYNGLNDYPETTMLKLSDAFITQPEQVPLELEVKVYNINKSKGAEVLNRCKTLDEYSLFVEEVRRQTQLDPENGFTNAVKICIEKGILKEYLQRKAGEVINMLIAEYDYDTDIAVQREEAGKIAFARGISQGKSLGLAQGKSLGLAEGTRQKALETARLMKQRNYPPAEICLMTGLSQAEVEALK